MAKFGRFMAGEQRPYETYEGDYLTIAGNGEHVNVMSDESSGDKIVTTVWLKQGESVRKISD